MNALFKKLNYKEQKTIYCLNHPTSFNKELKEMAEWADVKNRFIHSDKIEFILVFVKTQKEIDKWVTKFAPLLEGDALVWMVYPKRSSQNYNCDFNRDTGWQVLGDNGMEGVRIVAVDDDWSALRFRKIEYIKNFKRKFEALSEEGKERAKKNKD